MIACGGSQTEELRREDALGRREEELRQKRLHESKVRRQKKKVIIETNEQRLDRLQKHAEHDPEHDGQLSLLERAEGQVDEVAQSLAKVSQFSKLLEGYVSTKDISPSYYKAKDPLSPRFAASPDSVDGGLSLSRPDTHAHNQSVRSDERKSMALDRNNVYSPRSKRID